jgi:hypothetical protein
LNWNGDLDYPNESEDEWVENDDSDVEVDDDIKAGESPWYRVVSAVRTVPDLIRRTLRSMKHNDEKLMTVSTMETRRKKGNTEM